MKKFIIPIIIFFLIFFFIGLFLSKKETSLKTTKENQNEISTSSLPEIDKRTESFSILEFERRVNEDVNKLTKELKPDENKSVEEYNKEITQIQQRLKFPENTQKIDSETLIKISRDLEDISKELSQINPPLIFYSFHLELIKIYYKLGLAFKELGTTNDSAKKVLLYNLIKATLEKMRF